MALRSADQGRIDLRKAKQQRLMKVTMATWLDSLQNIYVLISYTIKIISSSCWNSKPFVFRGQTEPSVCLADWLSLSYIMHRWQWKINNKLALYNWLNIFANHSVYIAYVE
jgi:hypothetical protein